MDVPLYTATGWGNAAVLGNKGIPVTAGYPYPVWGDVNAMSPFCLFKDLHAEPDYAPVRYDPGDYPSFSVEMGAGIQIIYDKRDRIMMAEDIEDLVRSFFVETGAYLAKKATNTGRDEGIISGEALKKLVEPAFVPEGSFPAKAYDEATVEEGGEDLGEFLYGQYLRKRKTIDKKLIDQIERQISLTIIDRNWTRHIDTMAHLREGIGLRSYAQTNPLQDYVNEGYSLFREMNDNISRESAFYLMNFKPVIREPAPAPTEEAQASGKVVEAEAKPAEPVQNDGQDVHEAKADFKEEEIAVEEKPVKIDPTTSEVEQPSDIKIAETKE